MTNKEIKERLARMAKLEREVASSPKEALEALVGAGIYTEKGNVRKFYRQ